MSDIQNQKSLKSRVKDELNVLRKQEIAKNRRGNFKDEGSTFLTPEEAQTYLAEIRTQKKTKVPPTPPRNLPSAELNDWFSRQRKMQLEEQGKRVEAEKFLRGYRQKFDYSKSIPGSPSRSKSENSLADAGTTDASTIENVLEEVQKMEKDVVEKKIDEVVDEVEDVKEEEEEEIVNGDNNNENESNEKEVSNDKIETTPSLNGDDDAVNQNENKITKIETPSLNGDDDDDVVNEITDDETTENEDKQPVVEVDEIQEKSEVSKEEETKVVEDKNDNEPKSGNEVVAEEEPVVEKIVDSPKEVDDKTEEDLKTDSEEEKVKEKESVEDKEEMFEPKMVHREEENVNEQDEEQVKEPIVTERNIEPKEDPVVSDEEEPYLRVERNDSFVGIEEKKSISKNDTSDESWRDMISSEPGALFAPEPNRYHLYVSHACPWAHRTVIVLALKGLEDVIGLTYVHPTWQYTKAGMDEHRGWVFGSKDGDNLTSTSGAGSFPSSWGEEDPNMNAKTIRDIYEKVNDTTERYILPVLWDKKLKTIVSNESSEIIRMLNLEFNEYTSNPDLNLYPESLADKIDEINQWIYPSFNNGVYRCGLASTQECYDVAIDELTEAFDKVDSILQKQRFIAGDTFTEADVRLFVTLIRFDEVYDIYFKTNTRSVSNTPAVLNYVRDIYQMKNVAKTCNMEMIKAHYYTSHVELNKYSIIPRGVDFMALLDKPHNRESL